MDLARHHRLRAPYLRFEGQRCRACRSLQFPPGPLCSRCRSSALEPHALSGRGVVQSWSEVSHAPTGFEAPYVVALVRLEEGPVVSAQLTDVDSEDVTIGMAVEVVTRRLREHGAEGLVSYGYKFRPVLQGR